jgi:glucosamine-6-phosphate deaminase
MQLMGIEVFTDEAALAVGAADVICNAVRAESTAVLGLPTGKTPIATYAEIERRLRAGDADFGEASAFALDEFAGVEPTSPGTNAVFFRIHLPGPLPLHLPDPTAIHLDGEIATFANGVRAAGGFDLCVLGIGVNGHIAFNEPPSARDAPARIVDLTQATREAHAEDFGGIERVPDRGMTLGVADILESRKIIVLASGAEKASIVARAIEDRPSAAVPASWLQSHDNVTWMLDAAAAAKLARR